jgi:integrase/recombinase XerC
MAITTRKRHSLGASLRSLEKGFILTCQTEGKSTRTVEYYRDNLRRFLWYAEQKGWPDDARLITEWEIRDFLAYVSNTTQRWGLKGNGSESSRGKASHSTTHHYFVVLSTFFNWAVREGFLSESPLVRIKVARPKPKLIQPYTREEIQAMLKVCDWDYQHNARFLGSRNRAIVLVLLDTGVRLSELAEMRLSQINAERGWVKVEGKGGRERESRPHRQAYAEGPVDLSYLASFGWRRGLAL